MMRSDEPQRCVILVLVCAVLTCLGFEPAHGQAKNVPDGPEGASRRRIYYLLSNLNVSGTPIEDWKLELVSATATQD
jgi:hypothetical protein